MRPFDFQSAESADLAQASHNQKNGARFLAGGTNLVDNMKLAVEIPERLVDITHLPFTQITEDGTKMRIGALVTNSDLAHNASVKRNFPVLSQALLSGASPQLRNMATVGGNLLQRTRCSYFRDVAWACNKRNPGSGCSAMDGFNRMNAVLGTSAQCIATHPSDMCVALTALEAQAEIRDLKGQTRLIDIGVFFRVPGETPHIETILQPGELITAVEIPKRAWNKNSVYVKVRDRASYAFALASAAVVLEVKSGKVSNARVALGGVGTVPWRSPAAEKALVGKKLDDASLKEVATKALEGAQVREHNKYKIILAQQTLVRALKKAGGIA